MILKPGGKYLAKDLYEIGGVPIIMKALIDGGYFYGDCLTVNGKTIKENLKDIIVDYDRKKSFIQLINQFLHRAVLLV